MLYALDNITLRSTFCSQLILLDLIIITTSNVEMKSAAHIIA
jgi:hypothetical protein